MQETASNHELQVNDTMLESVSLLLQKIDQESIRKIEKLQFFQSYDNTMTTYDKVNEIVQKTSNVYNLCLQQVSQELLKFNLGEYASQYQKIFNGLNTQINQVLNCQFNLIKWYQQQDKKQAKLKQNLQIKKDNGYSIPPSKKGNFQEKQRIKDLPYEDQVKAYLLQSQNEEMQRNNILLETKQQLIQTEKQLNKCDKNASNNIYSINDTLNRKSKLSFQSYSGAKDIYRELLLLVNQQQNNSMTLLQSLKSYWDIDSDSDQSLSPESRKKKRQEKIRRRMLQKQLIQQKVENGDWEIILQEIQNHFGEKLSAANQEYLGCKEVANSIIQLARQLIQILKNCKCKVLEPTKLKRFEMELNLYDSQINAKELEIQKQEEEKAKNLKTIKLSGIQTTVQKQQQTENQQGIKIDKSSIKPIDQISIEEQIKNKLNEANAPQDKNNILIKKKGKKKGDSQDIDQDSENEKQPQNIKNKLEKKEQEENQKIQDQKTNNSIAPQQAQMNGLIQPVLPQGVTQMLDKNGKPMVDKKGNPIFVDASGKQVKLTMKQKKAYEESLQLIQEQQQKIQQNLPPGSQIIQKTVQKEIKQNFIYKDGVKVEVFMDENGDYYQKDESGNPQMLSKEDLKNIQTETKIITVVQNVMVDKNGKESIVEINKNGQIEVVNKKGKRQTMGPLQNNTQLDSDGNKIYIDPKTGKKQMVLINEKGEQFIINEKGEEVVIGIEENFTEKVHVNPDGSKFIISKDGKKLNVFVNEYGEECIKDENGYVVPVQSIIAENAGEMKQQIFYDENGEKFVLGQNGERLQIKTDENGNQYFQNKNGQKQLISKQALEQEKGKQQIFMNSKGEMYTKDKNGKVSIVEIDQFGQQFMIGENGEKIQINQSKEGKQAFNFDVLTNEKGERYIIDKKGNKCIVKKDQNGNEYVISDKGEKVTINQDRMKLDINLKMNAHKLKQKLKNKDIFVDDSGQQYIIDKSGRKSTVQYTKDGKPFIRDEKGNMKMVHEEDQPQIMIDEDGNQTVIVNGQKQVIQTNEKGEKFFINEYGEIQIMNDIGDESESEDEPLPDYIDVSGNCKYCGAKYVPKVQKYKGDVYLDEKGERYILDQNGNKVQLQTNEKGQFFYIDSNGCMIIMSRNVKYKQKGWLVKSKAIRNVYDPNVKQYDQIYRKFKTDDKELIEKVSNLDDKTQQFIMQQFDSSQYQQIIEITKKEDINSGDIFELYELIREINANYKMSDEEFVAKIKNFKRQHKKCKNECTHVDLFYKKMFVQNQIQKAIKRMGKNCFIQAQSGLNKNNNQQKQNANKSMESQNNENVI